jgi:hypothetical protein
MLIADTSVEQLLSSTIPPQIVGDLLTISWIPWESIANVAEALEKETAFLSQD